MTLRYANDRVECQLAICDWRVLSMLEDLERFAHKFGWDLWVTSVFRTDGSSHDSRAPYRFIDVDFVEAEGEDQTVGYHGMGEWAAEHLNHRYIYGRSWSGRKLQAALWHNVVPEADRDTDREGHHIHLQVPAGEMKIAPGY